MCIDIRCCIRKQSNEQFDKYAALSLSTMRTKKRVLGVQTNTSVSHVTAINRRYVLANCNGSVTCTFISVKARTPSCMRTK